MKSIFLLSIYKYTLYRYYYIIFEGLFTSVWTV
jgi:hypothetical protein